MRNEPTNQATNQALKVKLPILQTSLEETEYGSLYVDSLSRSCIESDNKKTYSHTLHVIWSTDHRPI